ncbi:MAG: SDR family oxidoreductase [Candidatus Marsarchaeota archaeon]|nr:SDR family oxidoreductase [Candidatus Marsarchaeota archaeon]
MKIIITGGAGFIGSHLAQALCGRHEVVVIDNLSSGRIENLSAVKNRVKFVKADITKPQELAPHFAGADAVLHQAALTSVAESMEDPKPTLETNVEGTRNVLERARKADVPRVVLASSASVYGNAKKQPVGEDAPLTPMSPYAESKMVNELDAREYHEKYGMKTVSLRYFNVYGPRQRPDSDYAAVVPKFAAQMLEGKPPTIYGNGKQSRDFVFVNDVAAANELALKAGSGFGEAYNIAFGKSVSINELYKAIARETKFEGKPHFEPAREGDILRSGADISKAKKALGFRPAVSLQAGLKETVQWFREQKEGGSRKG